MPTPMNPEDEISVSEEITQRGTRRAHHAAQRA